MTIETVVDSPVLTPLGQLIKDTAKDQGLSMRALAKSANITYAGLWKLMKTPGHKPNLSTLVSLSSALGLSLEALITLAQPAEKAA